MIERFIFAILILDLSYGCIEFSFKADDGSVTVGRSMESADEFKTLIQTMPVEKLQHARVPESCGNKRMHFYNAVRYTKLSRSFPKENAEKIYSGLNNAGLSVNVFYLNSFSNVDEELPQELCEKGISQLEVANYILSLFRKVDEIKAAIELNKFPSVWPEKLTGVVQSCRYSISDEHGHYLVLEYAAKTGITVLEKEHRVLTDVLNYEWHMETLKKYADVRLQHGELKITPLNKPSKKELQDFSLEGRFKKLVTNAYSSQSPENSKVAINKVFQTFDSTDVTKDNKGKNEITKWSVAYDLSKRCLHYRSSDVLSVRFICLKDIPLDAASSIELEHDYGSDEQDMSSKLKVFGREEEL